MIVLKKAIPNSLVYSKINIYIYDRYSVQISDAYSFAAGVFVEFFVFASAVSE